MQPRLVVSDLDGTLLDEASRISSTTVAALERASRAGAEVVVATGRSRWSALPILAGVDVVRWLICSNGAVVYDRHTEEVVVSRPMGDEQATEVMAAVLTAFPEAGLAWETTRGLFYSEAFRRNRERARPGSAFGTTSPHLDPDDRTEILRVMVAHPRLVQHDWLDALRGHLAPELEVSTSSADMVEICGSGTEKGRALVALATDLGLALDASVAFGDHANDLGLLRTATRGYVMANADPRMIDVSPWRAPHHADHGVAQVLDELFDG
jgi:Cof subfamily protein (haloacid dehalogenase superfamily)